MQHRQSVGDQEDGLTQAPQRHGRSNATRPSFPSCSLSVVVGSPSWGEEPTPPWPGEFLLSRGGRGGEFLLFEGKGVDGHRRQRCATSTMRPTHHARESRRLYRELMRKIRLLPEETKGYYLAYTRENFVSYADEDEPNRIRELQQLAQRHAQWVMEKYHVQKKQNETT